VSYPAHAASRRLVFTIAPQILGLLVLASSSPGKVLAGGPAPEAAPLDLQGGTDLGRVEEGEMQGFSPDGRILAVTTRGTFQSVGPVRLWDLRSRKELAPVAVGWKKLEKIRFSPNSVLIAAHDKKEGMGVWDALTGKQVMAFRPKTIFENYVSFWFSPDSKALIYEHYGEKFPDDNTLNVRDIGAARDRASFTGQPYMLGLSANGRIATGTTARTHDKRDRVLLWAWDEEKPPTLLKDFRVRVDQVAFSPDLASFATVDGADVRIVDMASGRERMAFADRNEVTHIQSVEFSSDGKLLIVNSGGGSQLDCKTRSTAWDISGRRARRVGEFASKPAVSPDEGLFLAGARTESDVALVETATGRSAGRLTRNGDLTASRFGTFNNMKIFPKVAFSPDGRLAVVFGLCDDNRTSIVRVHQINPLRELGMLESYWNVMFAPDGRSMVAATAEGLLRLWTIRPVDQRK
jgi:WD40 repeat protein